MSAIRAPILVIAIGNTARGDDALGPLLAERLEALALPDVEILTEAQLQIEHALELVDRTLLVVIDAGRGTWAPYEVRSVEPAPGVPDPSHMLSPEGLLATYQCIEPARPPRSLLLCVRGESFGLGDGLSAAARRHLEAAWPELLYLCQSERMPIRPATSPANDCTAHGSA